jgi:hypothetical protein
MDHNKLSIHKYIENISFLTVPRVFGQLRLICFSDDDDVNNNNFISRLGHQIPTVTDNPRESCFLFQRISVTLQRFNAVCCAYAFEQRVCFYLHLTYLQSHNQQLLNLWESNTKGDKIFFKK